MVLNVEKIIDDGEDADNEVPDVDTDQPNESKDPIVINPNNCGPTTMASLGLTLFGLLALRLVQRRRY
jgi:MYXO-CTERM domain-containing protein